MTEKFCGSYFPEGMIDLRPSGSKIKIVFHSDDHTEKAGFFMKIGVFQAKKPAWIPNYYVNDVGYMLRSDPFEQASATFDVGFEEFVYVTWPKDNKLVADNFFPDTLKFIPMKWTTGATRVSSDLLKGSAGLKLSVN